MVKANFSLEDTINLFYARHFAYDVLRRFFIEEPSREYLKEFVRKNMIDLFPFRDESEEIREGVMDIKEYLSTHDVLNIDRHYQDLHWDYTRMFIGPDTLPTPPWESVYVRKDKLLFQDTTTNVQKIYRKYGIMVSDNNIEADDHIGLELDFMFYLNELCLTESTLEGHQDFNKLTELLNEQHQFLQKHLLAFVPQMSKGIISEANTQFYVGMAKMANGYLQFDSTVLHELLNIEPLIEGGTKNE